MDGYVGKVAAYGPSQAVLGFGFAVNSFDFPAVALVGGAGPRVPSAVAAPRSGECLVAVDDEDRAAFAAVGTSAAEWTRSACAFLCAVCPSVS